MATMAGVLATLAFAGSGDASASGPVTPEAGASWSHLSEPGFGAVVTALSIDPHDGNHLLVGGEMDGIFTSRDGGTTFQPALGLHDYEIGEFTWNIAHPNEVWVGTMGGPYVSRDGGGTWTAARVGFPNPEGFCYSAPIEKVAVDPANANHLIAFGGSQRLWENSCEGNRSAVWESADGGVNWARKGQILAGVLGTAGGFVAGSSTTLLATVANGGVFRSTNSGATWTQASFGLTNFAAADLALHPTNPAVAWVSLGAEAWPGTQAGGVYKTVDGGANWLPVMNGLSAFPSGSPNVRSRYHEIEVSPSNPDILWVSDVGWAVKVIYRSSNGGASWQAVNGNFPARSFNAQNEAYSIAVDPADAKHVLIGNEEIAMATRDSGANWANLGESAVAGGWRGRGSSSMVSNKVTFNPFVQGQMALNAFDGGNLIWTDNAGGAWRRPLTFWDGWGGSYDTVFTGPNDAYVLLGQAGIFNGLAITHDGGRNWDVKAGAAAGLPERGTWSQTLAGSFAPTPNSLAVTIGGSVFRTINGGATWQRSVGADGVIDLAYDGRNNRVVGVSRSGVVVSVDGGLTFSSLVASPGGTRVTVDGLGRIYVADWQGAGLSRYENGGWLRLRPDATIYDVVVDPTDNRRIVVVTNDYPFHDRAAASGVWISANDGVSWTPRNEGLSMTRVSTAAFDPYVRGRLVIGSYGAGFWEIQLPEGDGGPPLTTPTTAPPAPAGKTLVVDLALMGAIADAAREQERALLGRP